MLRNVFLFSTKFKKLDKSPTVSYEVKIQHTLRKMKSLFTLQEYNKVYPTGSNAGKFHGTINYQN